jgi:hypothetical protein
MWQEGRNRVENYWMSFICIPKMIKSILDIVLKSCEFLGFLISGLIFTLAELFMERDLRITKASALSRILPLKIFTNVASRGNCKAHSGRL